MKGWCDSELVSSRLIYWDEGIWLSRMPYLLGKAEKSMRRWEHTLFMTMCFSKYC